MPGPGGPRPGGPGPGMGFGGMGRGIPTFSGNSYAFQNRMSQLMPMGNVPRGVGSGMPGESIIGDIIYGFIKNKAHVLYRNGEIKFGDRLKATGIALAKGGTNFAFENDFITKLNIAKEDLDKGKIDRITWARRIMKAAKSYYSYLKKICYYTEEDYQVDMTNFAKANGIEFHFDEERTRRR